MIILSPLSFDKHIIIIYQHRLFLNDFIANYAVQHAVNQTNFWFCVILKQGLINWDFRVWTGIPGNYGLRKCNQNGHMLLGSWLGYIAEHLLSIIETLIQLPTRHKTTWCNLC